MFRHTHHERTLAHQNDTVSPVEVHDNLRFNDKIAVFITKWVGSMWAAYLFILFTFTALPAALKSGPYTLVAWASSYFLQLVLLPIIMVGSNLIQRSMDRQNAEQMQDIKAILHEILEMQKHLNQQDVNIEELLSKSHGSEPGWWIKPEDYTMRVTLPDVSVYGGIGPVNLETGQIFSGKFLDFGYEAPKDIVALFDNEEWHPEGK